MSKCRRTRRPRFKHNTRPEMPEFDPAELKRVRAEREAELTAEGFKQIEPGLWARFENGKMVQARRILWADDLNAGGLGTIDDLLAFMQQTAA